VDNLYFLLSL